MIQSRKGATGSADDEPLAKSNHPALQENQVGHVPDCANACRPAMQKNGQLGTA